MERQLIKTKLHVPKLQKNHFSRKQLIDKINASSSGNLVLVSAPAGYGKTTLVSEWINEYLDNRVWYSLHEEDNNLVTFLYYLIEALRTIDKSFGSSILKEIEMLDSIGIESLLISMLNDFASYDDVFTLVLDDYHMIENKDIQRGVAFLLEHLPDNIRIIIITRNHDCLPISKLRAKNKLVEITIDDLMLNQDEISIFLSNYLEHELSSKEIGFISEKSEGWITSLHLFALSLLRQGNTDKLVESFSGRNDYVFEYLLEEVFNQQNKEVQNFLMVTSLFSRFSLSLCSDILEITMKKSSEILNTISKANLFLVNLDNQRRWYRYHHLFQDFLRKRFVETIHNDLDSKRILDKASIWFEEKQLIDEAVQYSFKAKNYPQAARLLELEWAEIDRKLESSMWLEWIRSIPRDILKNRPVLNAGYAWALLDNGIIEDCENHLKRAESLMNDYHSGSSEVVVFDHTTFDMLPSIINSAKSYLYTTLGRYEEAYKCAINAKNTELSKGIYDKRIVNTILGLAQWSLGKLTEAFDSVNHNINSVKMRVSVSIVLGELMIEQGYLNKAEEFYRETIRLLNKEEGICNQVEPSLLLGLSWISLCKGNVYQAKEYLNMSKEIGVHNSVRTWKYHYHRYKAWVDIHESQYDEALNNISKAEQHKYSSAVPKVQKLDEMKILVFIKQRRVNDVFEWLDEFRYYENIEYIHEFETFTFIKALIFKYQILKSNETLRKAESIIQKFITKLEDEKRTLALVDAIVQLVRVNLYQDMKTEASNNITKAIQLASSQKYKKPFVDIGDELIDLLSELDLRPNQNRFMREVIQSINTKLCSQHKLSKPCDNLELIVPLSKRENEILVLISRGLSNEDISKKLFLALSTVKNYNHSLFGKLQVKSRTEAIRKASDLGIT